MYGCDMASVHTICIINTKQEKLKPTSRTKNIAVRVHVLSFCHVLTKQTKERKKERSGMKWFEPRFLSRPSGDDYKIFSRK